MSRDGSTIAITYSSNKNIDVFLNNGTTFNVHQSIPSTIGFIDIAITGRNVLYVSSTGVAAFSKDSNGDYQFFNSVSGGK